MMKSRLCLAGLSLLWNCILGASVPQSYLLEPSNNSCISNECRLSISVPKTMNPIEQVVFYAGYYTAGVYQKDHLIGRDSVPPYELIWSTEEVREDQGVYICWDILMQSGKILHGDKSLRGETICLILDRHPEFLNKEMQSLSIQQAIIVDGDLKDWDQSGGIQFGGGNNIVRALSQWDYQNLYFALEVQDQYLYVPSEKETLAFDEVPEVYATADEKIYQNWLYDGVEICLDTKLDRSCKREADDIDFIFNPDGFLTVNVRYPEDDLYKFAVKKYPLEYRFSLQGTLNDNADLDSGYVLEAAIPWSCLKIKPFSGLRMGLDLTNVDRKDLATERIFNSWSLSKNVETDNPSEWGNIVLVKKTHLARALVVFAVLLLSGCSVFILSYIMIRKQKIWKENRPRPADKEEIRKAKDFIEKLYTDEELDRDRVAAEVHLSPSHFSYLFKKETGLKFNQYLNQFRIGKAVELLINTQENISQIAFAVGFGSLEHFDRTFRKIKKLSPKEYSQSLSTLREK